MTFSDKKRCPCADAAGVPGKMVINIDFDVTWIQAGASARVWKKCFGECPLLFPMTEGKSTVGIPFLSHVFRQCTI